jgi:hypothetical protein
VLLDRARRGTKWTKRKEDSRKQKQKLGGSPIGRLLRLASKADKRLWDWLFLFAFSIFIFGVTIALLQLLALKVPVPVSQRAGETSAADKDISAPGSPVPTTGASAGVDLRQKSPPPSVDTEATSGPSTWPEGPAPAMPAAPATAAGSFRILLDEHFPDNRGNWPSNPRSTAWLSNGDYHLLARRPGEFVAIRVPVAEWLRDVTVSGTFRKVGGPPGGGYGLIIRDQAFGAGDGIGQEGWYYVLQVSDGGEVGIWRREGERWVDLLPWKRSHAVRVGNARNDLTAQATGQRLVFLVNGVQVARLLDLVFLEGAVGVFVGGDFNEVVLDRFVVQTPS